MSDFSAEDLFDAIDRIVRELLVRHFKDAPPVDAMVLAQDEFHFSIDIVEETDQRTRQYGDAPPRRPRPREILLRESQSDEARQAVCARACAKELIPLVLEKLGVTPGTENRGAQNSLIGLIAPRILLPTCWFEKDSRKLGYDLLALKALYSTAGHEMIALRWLDFEEPCLVTVIDNEDVTARRSNRAQVTRKLTEAEQRCRDEVRRHDEPQKVRHEAWTTWGWPVPGGPFNRIILRSVHDEI